MPTVEKVGGPRVVVRDIGEFSPGDRADVSDDAAAYLCEECGGFRVVDDDNGSFDFAPGDHDDFATNGWLDNDYQDRAEAVRAGGLDDFLGEIEDAERSDTVLDAVAERRAELKD
jgi:hypothetical protein